MARPRKEIKKESFEKLCNLMCTKEEMCGFFGVDQKTLTRWCKDTYGEGYSQCYNKYSQDGKISLRRAQFRLAEKSAAMAIFLGKNILGQSDHIKVESRSDGMLADLIDGLREPYDLHRKATGANGSVADEPTETNQPT